VRGAPCSIASRVWQHALESPTVADNKLFYGDNLDVLRRYVRDESVDLIYLDPPFNSRQDYNVLFAEKDGTRSSCKSPPSRTPGSGTSTPSTPTRKSSSAVVEQMTLDPQE
jgi:hypothetical protein